MWRLKLLNTEKFSRVYRDQASRERKHVPCTWLECEESGQMETAVSREYLVGKAFPRDTRKTFCSASLSSLIHIFCAYTIYIHITHKCNRELLRENPSKNTWELEIVNPTILYTFVCGISSSPTSPFPYHWEVNSPNTYHTFKSVQWGFGATGKHWKKPRMADATWSLLRDPES